VVVPALEIVIPAYNEARRIAPSLRNVAKWLGDAGRKAEIIVVDDGSSDATCEVVARLALPGVRLLRQPENRGKGAAVRAAVATTTAEAVLISDADLISELPRLEAELAEAEVVIGSRAVERSQIEVRQPAWREWSGRTFNLAIRLLGFRGVHDSQCGFKLLRGDVARQLFALMTVDRYAFDVELLWLANRHGYRVREVGVAWSNDPSSHVRVWRDGSRMLLDVVTFRWRHRGRRYGAVASKVAR